MNATLGRAAGIGLGLLVVIVGFSLFTPDAGLPQTPATVALASVLVALGIGAIGAALMPGTLTINGKDVTPLGLSGSATGGAAFFVATLVFLYATGVNKPGGEAKPAPEPTIAATGVVSGVPSATPTPIAEPSRDAPPIAAAGARSASPPPDGDDVDQEQPSRPVQSQSQIGPSQPQMVRVRTYCSTCCPQGPQGCPNYGVGMAPTLQQAAEIAARYCIASGGHADTCYANVEQF